MKFRTLLSITLLVMLGACGGGGDDGSTAAAPPTPSAPVAKPGVLSLSSLPRLNPMPTTVQEYATVAQAAFDLAYEAGVRGQMTTFTWKDLEPTVGAYSAQRFSDLNAAIDNARSRGMTQFVGIQVINTVAREMPAELSASEFDDPGVRQQFRLLLDRIFVPANRGRIRYLSIGNEVDAYLRAHPAEWQRYKSFLTDMVSYVHSLDPGVQVGVTGTADGALIQSPTELADLNSVADVVILTYYPISFSQQGAAVTVTVDSPGAVANEVPLMLGFAGAKSLVLQEVGYPASPMNQSSDALQAQFVSNVFAAWKSSNGRIPFLNYFLLHDFTAQMCEQFAAYYGAANVASFEAYLCSLGLRHDDGTPRSAWNQFVTEAQQAGLP